MFKRSQREVSESSKHWYQDKYQHVLTQRNVFALIALVSLITAAVAVTAVARLAPLKSVEPYLLQIDEKTGITQKVNVVAQAEYSSNEKIDRYFTSMYLRAREGYNYSVLSYNYNIVRLLSTPGVYYGFRRQVNAQNENSLAAHLGTTGQRDIKIKSMNYIASPAITKSKKPIVEPKIMQARITTIDSVPNGGEAVQEWVITVTFEYKELELTLDEQMINPLGYTITSYQIQREIN